MKSRSIEHHSLLISIRGSIELCMSGDRAAAMFLTRTLAANYRRNAHDLLGRHGLPSPHYFSAARLQERSRFGLQGYCRYLVPHASFSSSTGNGTSPQLPGPNKKGGGGGGAGDGGNVPPPPVLPTPAKGPTSFLLYWAKWLFGSVLGFVLPLWSTKWRKIQQIEGEVERVAEVVETVVDAVEVVATMTEKVSSEVAEKLPEDGKLKEVVEFVEHVSKEMVEEVETAKDVIHKVDELKQEVETLLDPITDIAKHVKGEGSHHSS